MDGDTDYMVNCCYYGVKTLHWLTVDYIWIDQLCMCMIEAMLNCVIYRTHVPSLVLLMAVMPLSLDSSYYNLVIY